MAALLNNPIDNLAMNNGTDDDNQYKKILLQQLGEQAPRTEPGPSSNQLLASLNNAANQVGAVGGKIAQSPEVQKFADLVDQSKNLAEQQRLAQLNKQQGILAELAKIRDQTAEKAQNRQQMAQDREANRENALELEDRRAKNNLALEAAKAESSQKIAEMRGENKKPPTQDQANSSMFAVRAKDAANLAKQIEDSGYKPADYGAVLRNINFPLVGPVFAEGPDRSYDQARRDFVSAVLRKESGAAISNKEYADEAIKYFPQPGDGPQQLAQKAAARDRAIQGLINAAGPAYSPEMQHPFPYHKEDNSSDTAYAQSAKGPKPGDVEGGYKFKGGDPSNQANWEEVK